MCYIKVINIKYILLTLMKIYTSLLKCYNSSQDTVLHFKIRKLITMENVPAFNKMFDIGYTGLNYYSVTVRTFLLQTVFKPFTNTSILIIYIQIWKQLVLILNVHSIN